MSQQGIFAIGIERYKNEQTLDILFVLIEALATCKLDISKDYLLGKELPDLTLYQEYLPEIDENNASYSQSRLIIVKCGETQLQSPVKSVAEAHLKLQAMSQRLFKPHEICLDGVFGILPNLAWTNYGPILLSDLDKIRAEKFSQKIPLQISHVDKFPYLINYHVPEGIRIADGGRVRLGAYLGEGTTIMPAGYVNFNAGTQGNAMVEGRVSAGVFVDNGSDIGGGASIMGTLSGGNKDVIAIGKNSLLGANAGVGISIGDGCTVAAGLYIYAGMKVSLYDKNNNPINLVGATVNKGENIVKARELSGRDYLLFLQDSQTGEVICKPNTKVIELNAQLHKN